MDDDDDYIIHDCLFVYLSSFQLYMLLLLLIIFYVTIIIIKFILLLLAYPLCKFHYRINCFVTIM